MMCVSCRAMLDVMLFLVVVCVCLLFLVFVVGCRLQVVLLCVC